MRRHGAAHDVERIAVAAFLGIEPGHDLQRPDLGFVAPPDRRERLQLGDDVLTFEIAERIAQSRLTQPTLRRRRAVLGIRRCSVSGERVLVAPHSFGHSPDQHGDRRLQLVRQTDGLEIVEFVGGAGEIADLDGGTHFALERDPLQLHRHRGDGRFDTLETIPRQPPLTLTRIGQRTPQRRVVLIADRRIGEILQCSVGPVHHHFGHGAQYARSDVFAYRTALSQRHVKHALRFRIHVAGDVETSEIKPLLQTLGRRRGGRSGDELRLAFAINRLPIEAPDLCVKHHRP